MNRKLSLAFVTSLTFGRVPLVMLFFVGAIVHALRPNLMVFWAALLCLAASALTDLFDGHFARKLKVTTEFGAYADPLSDKIFYLASLPVLVFLAAFNDNTIHAVVLVCFTMLFLLRDQWVSFLRSIGSTQGFKANANWSGKLRTIINFPLICFIYYTEGSDYPSVSQNILYIFEAAGFAINLISIWIYTREYWQCMKNALTLDD